MSHLYVVCYICKCLSKYSFVNRLAIFGNDWCLNVCIETFKWNKHLQEQCRNKMNWKNWKVEAFLSGSIWFPTHSYKMWWNVPFVQHHRQLLQCKTTTCTTCCKQQNFLSDQQVSQVSVKYYQVLQSKSSHHKLAQTDTTEERWGGLGMDQGVRWYYQYIHKVVAGKCRGAYITWQ